MSKRSRIKLGGKKNSVKGKYYYVIRRKDGTFQRFTNINKSIKADARKIARRTVKPGYGHQGDLDSPKRRAVLKAIARKLAAIKRRADNTRQSPMNRREALLRRTGPARRPLPEVRRGRPPGHDPIVRRLNREGSIWSPEAQAVGKKSLRDSRKKRSGEFHIWGSN